MEKRLLPDQLISPNYRMQTVSSTQKYAFSFTIGALLSHESLKLATLFLELENWELVRDTVIKDNTLQTGTVKSSVRLCQELCSRLKTLSDTELRLLVEGSIQEKGYMLWLAICRRYTFVRDFAVEVLRGKLLDLDTELKKEDFEVFFNHKAEWHEELVQIKPTTRAKARQTIFRMLREAHLLTSEDRIYPAILSSALVRVITSKRSDEVLCFPVIESQLTGYIR